MRLDKYLCEATEHTRKVAKKAIAFGDVEINGVVVTNPASHVPNDAAVKFRGIEISLIGQRYIMLHKPVDVICSTEDTEAYECVISLLDIEKPERLHVAGRLDADTTGLVLITDDGQWSHKVTSPKKHCEKTYLAELAEPVGAEEQLKLIELFEKGIQLNGEDNLTLPAKLVFIHPDYIELKVTEGRYHQVKRMFAAVGNKVTYLHRCQIGDISLGDDLAVCEWRYLTEAEVKSF